ncbi:hypothetical protein M231_05886 [Tremella mesenterica]|uniref:Uncharacterized protein n=1 Tax=Tremella mesenterica TaxID=5217 RepID=A0A4Q1BGY9_TREME|nr:hypothetical protein M231_05886 [Tremella mesenterica]
MTTLLQINPDIDLTELHRLLVDKEAGLRSLGLTPNNPPAAPYPNQSRFPRQRQSGSPPTPCCTCGENHWSSQCPKRQGTPQQKQQRTTPPNNNTRNSNQTTNNNSPPRRYNNNTNSNNNNPNRQPIQNPRPYGNNQQPRKQWDNSRPPPPREVNINTTEEIPSANIEDVNHHILHTPAYAQATLNGGQQLHQVMCDTGAAVSLANPAYIRKYLPNEKVEPTSSFTLKGLGATSPIWGHVRANLTFPTPTPVTIRVTFHLTPSAPNGFLLGNDSLKPLGATVDLNNNQLILKNHASSPISLSTSKPDIDPEDTQHQHEQ